MKKKLIAKVLERANDMEPEESLDLVGLDFISVIEDAVREKLESLTEEQLLELL